MPNIVPCKLAATCQDPQQLLVAASQSRHKIIWASGFEASINFPLDFQVQVWGQQGKLLWLADGLPLLLLSLSKTFWYPKAGTSIEGRDMRSWRDCRYLQTHPIHLSSLAHIGRKDCLSLRQNGYYTLIKILCTGK